MCHNRRMRTLIATKSWNHISRRKVGTIFHVARKMLWNRRNTRVHTSSGKGGFHVESWTDFERDAKGLEEIRLFSAARTCNSMHHVRTQLAFLSHTTTSHRFTHTSSITVQQQLQYICHRLLVASAATMTHWQYCHNDALADKD